MARLRGELDHVQAALGERELVVQHHQQRVAEATAQSREFREMAARKREELNAQAQQFEEVTINLRMMNATLAGKTLEVQRLVGVVATLSAREREGAEEVDQLQMTLHRLQEELSALQGILDDVDMYIRVFTWHLVLGIYRLYLASRLI